MVGSGRGVVVVDTTGDRATARRHRATTTMALMSRDRPSSSYSSPHRRRFRATHGAFAVADDERNVSRRTDSGRNDMGLVFGMHRYRGHFESMYDDAVGREDDDDENEGSANVIVATTAVTIAPPSSMAAAGNDDVVDGEDVIDNCGSMMRGGSGARVPLAVPSTTTSIESGEGDDGDEDASEYDYDDVAISTDVTDAPAAAAADATTIDPDRTYVLRFDGGSRGNPGRAGAGMVLYDGLDGNEIWTGYHYLGDKYTNNEAEYRGLITGMRCALSLGVRHIVIQGDSQLILRQLDGKYRVKSPTLLSYYREALDLVREFDSAETGHIERSRNGRADELANLAMDSRSSMGFTN